MSEEIGGLRWKTVEMVKLEGKKEFCEDLKMRLRSFNTTVSSAYANADDYHDLYKTVMAYIDEVLTE